MSSFKPNSTEISDGGVVLTIGDWVFYCLILFLLVLECTGALMSCLFSPYSSLAPNELEHAPEDTTATCDQGTTENAPLLAICVEKGNNFSNIESYSSLQTLDDNAATSSSQSGGLKGSLKDPTTDIAPLSSSCEDPMQIASINESVTEVASIDEGSTQATPY